VNPDEELLELGHPAARLEELLVGVHDCWASERR
jgi:hypothetical protein